MAKSVKSEHVIHDGCCAALQCMVPWLPGYARRMGVDPALVRMLRAGTDKGRDVDRSLDALAGVFGRGRTARRLGPHFSCSEANVVAWVLLSSGHGDAATVWLDEHSSTDGPDDLHGHPEFDAVRYLRPSRSNRGSRRRRD